MTLLNISAIHVPSLLCLVFNLSSAGLCRRLYLLKFPFRALCPCCCGPPDIIHEGPPGIGAGGAHVGARVLHSDRVQHNGWIKGSGRDQEINKVVSASASHNFPICIGERHSVGEDMYRQCFSA